MPTDRKPPLSPATGEFGRRVRARREQLGLSQEKLAERTTLHCGRTSARLNAANATLASTTSSASPTPSTPTLVGW